jgi:hypothetical protein
VGIIGNSLKITIEILTGNSAESVDTIFADLNLQTVVAA